VAEVIPLVSRAKQLEMTESFMTEFGLGSGDDLYLAK